MTRENLCSRRGLRRQPRPADIGMSQKPPKRDIAMPLIGFQGLLMPREGMGQREAAGSAAEPREGPSRCHSCAVGSRSDSGAV